MHTTLSAIALLVAGTSVSAESQRHESQSYLPTTLVRSFGLKAVQMAHSQALARRSMLDIGKIVDGVMGAINAATPIMCGILELGMPHLTDEMEAIGMVCSKFGCDDPFAKTPNLIMNCNFSGELCSKAFDENFCITDTNVQTSMELDFVDKSEFSSNQCSTYTSPDYMVALGRVCLMLDVTLDVGALTDDITSGELDTIAEAAEHVQINDCSGELRGVGIECECGFCNEGVGFKLSCNNFLSEECTNFDTSVADISAITEGGTINGPSLSVLRLVPAPTPNPTGEPTASPSTSPSVSPTTSPTGRPTTTPTMSPSASPTKNPTGQPTASPTKSTESPTDPTELATDPTESASNRSEEQATAETASSAAIRVKAVVTGAILAFASLFTLV